MHLNDQPGSPGCNGRERHGMYLVALTRAVAGIDNDGQVTQALYSGHDAQVERVARMIGEGPNAALAQDRLVVTFRKNSLRRPQKLFQPGRHTAVMLTRKPRSPLASQQLTI